jgi:hypothetical protein
VAAVAGAVGTARRDSFGVGEQVQRLDCRARPGPVRRVLCGPTNIPRHGRTAPRPSRPCQTFCPRHAGVRRTLCRS